MCSPFGGAFCGVRGACFASTTGAAAGAGAGWGAGVAATAGAGAGAVAGALAVVRPAVVAAAGFFCCACAPDAMVIDSAVSATRVGRPGRYDNGSLLQSVFVHGTLARRLSCASSLRLCATTCWPRDPWQGRVARDRVTGITRPGGPPRPSSQCDEGGSGSVSVRRIGPGSVKQSAQRRAKASVVLGDDQ